MYLWYTVYVHHEEKRDFDLREGTLRGEVYYVAMTSPAGGRPVNVLGCQMHTGLGGLP